MADDNNGPRGYRDGVYFVDVNAYVLPPLIGLPYEDMRLNGEGARHRDDPSYYRMVVAHAVFMCLGILFCIPFAIFQARFRAYKNPRRAIRSHILSNTVTFVVLSIGFACGYSATTNRRSWTNPHHIIGLTIYCAIWVQALLGAIVHHRGKYKVTPHLPFRTMLHRWLGRAIWLLGLAQVPLGLTLYGSPISLFILYAVYMFLLLLVYFTSEFFRGRQHGTATVTTETALDYQGSDKAGHHSEDKGFFTAGNLAKMGLGFLAAKKVKDHYTAREDMTADQSELSSRPAARSAVEPRRQHAGYESSVGVTNSEVNGGYNRTELTAYTQGTGYTRGTGYTQPTGYTNGTGYTTGTGYTDTGYTDGTGYTGTEDVESRVSPNKTPQAAAKVGLLAGLLSSSKQKKAVDTRSGSPSANAAKPSFFASLFKRNKAGNSSTGAKTSTKSGAPAGDGGWFDRNRTRESRGMSPVQTEDYSESEDDDESRRRDGSPTRRALGAGTAAGLAAAHHRNRRHTASISEDSYYTDVRGTEPVDTTSTAGGLQAPPPAQNNNTYSNHRLPLGPTGANNFDSHHNIHSDHPSPVGFHSATQSPIRNAPPFGVPRPPIPGGGPSTGSHSRQNSTDTRGQNLGFVIPRGNHSDSELSLGNHQNRPAGSRSYRIPPAVESRGSTGSMSGTDTPSQVVEHYIPQASLQVRIKKQDGGRTVTTIKRLPNRERGSADLSGYSSRSGDRSRRNSDYRVREERRRGGPSGAGGNDTQSDRETATDQEDELRKEREARRQRRRQKRETQEYNFGQDSSPRAAAYT